MTNYIPNVEELESTTPRDVNVITRLFIRASDKKGSIDDLVFRTDSLEMEGIKKFKRKLLGICGRNAVKTSEEVVRALMNIGVASSNDEGQRIVGLIEGVPLHYGLCGRKEMVISECLVDNVKRYAIKVHTPNNNYWD